MEGGTFQSHLYQGHDCREGRAHPPFTPVPAHSPPPPYTTSQPGQSGLTCISGCSSRNQRRGYVWACIMSTGTVNCSFKWKLSLWVRLGSNLLLQKPRSSRRQGPCRPGQGEVLYHPSLLCPTQNPFKGQNVEVKTPRGTVPGDTQLI